MAVEITRVPGAQITTNQSDKPDSNSASKNSPSSTITTGSSTADSFTVSRRAEELRMIESNINAQSDFNGVRIESLKTEIDAGRYDINPLRVAEKLIELEIQFVA